MAGPSIPKALIPNTEVSTFKVFVKAPSGGGGGDSPLGIIGKAASVVKTAATGGIGAAASQLRDGYTPLDSRFIVTGLTINKSVNKIPFAQITLADGDVAAQDFPSSSSDMFIPGAEVKIVMGFFPTEKVVFKGLLIKHSIQLQQGTSSSLIIELKDEAVKLTVGRKNKIFEQQSDSQIIGDVLGDHKGDVENITGPHEEMVQYFSTDWDFVLSRAEVNGCLVFVEDGKVNVNKPRLDKSAVTKVAFGANVYEFDAEMDARDEYKSVVAKSWDDATRAVVEKTAGETGKLSAKDTFSKVADVAVDFIKAPTLGTVLGAVGEGTPSAKELAGVIGLDEYVLQHSGQLKNAELQAWADAKMARSLLAKIKGHAKIDGDVSLKPGDMIAISGFSKRFNGNAFVSSVTHSLSGSASFFTEIEFGYSQEWFSRKYTDVNELPASGLLPSVYGLQAGIVKEIANDPQNDYRIKVKLPMVSSGNEGVWARMATMDAGKKRGSFFRPEVGDEVILGFMNDDPREPVILGMLYSKNNDGKPPVEPTVTNYIKGFYTKNELKFVFDDQNQSVTIEAPDGNKIFMTNDKAGSGDAKITITDKNKNKVEMTKDGITIGTEKNLTITAKGDVKLSGNNITLEAKGQLKTSGNGVEVKSSANTVIKGTQVQIN